MDYPLPDPHGAAASQPVAKKDTHPLRVPPHRRKELFSFFQGKDSSEASETFKSCRQLSKIRDQRFKGQKGWKRDDRGWGEAAASRLGATVGWGAAHRLPSSALTFHTEDTMRHCGTLRGLGPRGQIWGYCRKKWCQGESTSPLSWDWNCTVGCTPTQPRSPSCCPHRGPVAPHQPKEQDTPFHAPQSHLWGTPQVPPTPARLAPTNPHVIQFVWDGAPVPGVPKDTPLGTPDLTQSSPGDILAGSGALAGTHWGEHPISPAQGLVGQGKPRWQGGKGVPALPTHHREDRPCHQGWRSRSGAAPRPPSGAPHAPGPRLLSHQLPTRSHPPGAGMPCPPQHCPGFAASQHEKHPHTTQPVLGNGFTPIPSSLISLICPLFLFQQQLALPGLLSLPVLYSGCMYNLCIIYINAAAAPPCSQMCHVPSLQKVRVPKPP